MIAIPRTCTPLRNERGGSFATPAEPAPLTAFRQEPAYVLLGDPGMGKSTAFGEERRAIGEDAILITARHFATFDAEDHPEWRDKTLFIDGLDEIRAGRNDPTQSVDRIRRNLDKLGKPRFRLSCRHADWLDTDRKSLEAVSATGEVAVLLLDPLDEVRAHELVARCTHIDDVDSFLGGARRRGLQGTLANPQSLTMLAQAVHAGKWPASRAATYEQACIGMAAEHNDEHLSVRPPGNADRVLDAAGRLCAPLLIAGHPGCATTPAHENDDYPCLAKYGSDANACREAIATRLFHFPQEGRAEPAHRHIAEFLAARHLASLIEPSLIEPSLIEQGLPAGRAIALLTAPDGRIATELRGLSAWLAVHSVLTRRELIARDPVGLALYGDIRAFTTDEKQALFDSLVREPRSLEPTYERAHAFAALATPSMARVLERALAARLDDSDHEIVADLVLRVLQQAPPLPRLSFPFLDIVRDRKRWPRVRVAALDTFIHYGRSDERTAELMALLRDIREQRIDDPDDQLLGQLLASLYPKLIPPAAVWDYMKDGNELHGGRHMMFWVADLPSRSSDQHVMDLLDGCHGRLDTLERASDATLERCVARLLVRALQTQGDSVQTAKLYDWLDAATRLRVGQYDTRDEGQSIRQWLGERPERHLELMLEGIGREPTDSWYAPYEAFKRLFGAQVSTGFHESCARAAKSMVETAPNAAESLLRFVVDTGRLDRQRARRAVGTHPTLTRLLDTLFKPVEPAPEIARMEEEQRTHHEAQRQKAQRGLEQLKAHEAALRTKSAPASMLHELARRYFGSFVGFTPERGLESLKAMVGTDERLLDAIVTGLQLARERGDVPNADTILDLRRKSKVHYLSWPFLASLAEAERTGSLEPAWWTEDRIRIALASYYGYARRDYEPSWYRHLIAAHPTTVSDVQVRFAAALLRDGVDPATANLWHLAFDRHHARIARYASIPLLRAFPTRAKRQLLHNLDYLLLAAYQHADATIFRRLIDNKLRRRSLPASHRGRWLAVGCAIAPAIYEDAAMDFVESGRRGERALHFASFFCQEDRPMSPVEAGGSRLAALLTRTIGQFVDPDEHREGLVTPTMNASTLIHHCIRVLAGQPASEATEALKALRADSRLARWHWHLSRAADDQQVNRRDHEYQHPTIEQVVHALDGGPAAGAPDLAALALDRLNVIATRIQSTNTDDWKQLWSEDRNGKPTKPKREESCTKAILSDLRQLLPEGVHAEPEVRHSGDTRADIRVSCGAAHVPIEVKRNDHPELWRALRSQLIAKDTGDIDTGGHGIYLVLWFGRDRTTRSPSGGRPATSDALKEQLESILTDAERLKIAVCVIDVSENRRDSGTATTARATGQIEGRQ